MHEHNCIKLDDDWQGADFLAYHKDGENTLKVQLKGRLTIAKKYINKDLWMAFPIENCWYLIPHSELLNIVELNTNWLNTPSWLDGAAYSAKAPSKIIIEKLEEFKL